MRKEIREIILPDLKTSFSEQALETVLTAVNEERARKHHLEVIKERLANLRKEKELDAKHREATRGAGRFDPQKAKKNAKGPGMRSNARKSLSGFTPGLKTSGMGHCKGVLIGPCKVLIAGTVDAKGIENCISDRIQRLKKVRLKVEL